MMKKRKRNRELRNTVDLPEDLLVEILSRVPEVPLARFRSTSKEWNALIKKDPRLARKPLTMLIDFRVKLTSLLDHHGIQDNVVKVTSQLSLKDPLSKSSEEVDIRDVFHCDGLLLCTTKDDRHVVWNPCSGETKWLQPTEKYKSRGFYALGKSSCNKYKVLRVVHHGNSLMQCRVECEIYDLTSSSWKGVGETRDWSIPGMWRRGVSVNENTYFIGYGYRPPWTKEFVLSFDFSTERFGHASLPGDDHLSDSILALSVTREDQKLCLLHTRSSWQSDVHVWISSKIESSGAMSWTKFLTVERNNHYQYFGFENGMSFLADQENKVLVCKNCNNFLHILGEDRYVRVDHHDGVSNCSLLVSYGPSLVQIQQAPIM